MELENLKATYQNTGKTSLNKEMIQKMISENKHPVAKSIKRQLVIETLLWGIFIAVYYDIFDGHLKSVLWNFILVIAVSLLLVHNTLGFKIIKSPINGETISESLKNYQNKIKNYAIVSMITRFIAIAILLCYFTSTITFNKEKIISLSFITIIFPIQIYLLNRVWKKRRLKINEILRKLKE